MTSPLTVTTPTRAIAGGTFAMGSERFYADEGPVVEVQVAPFVIDRHPVTNEQFAEFVRETGYVTTAEQQVPPELGGGEPGALVFQATQGPVHLNDWRQWWRWATGANWRHPFGPESDIADKAGHPVVQVSYDDATAYARWVGGRLPTEQEWEFAAQGGRVSTYAWGDDARPDGLLMANTWQGAFPYQNDGANGWRGTSPVGSFEPNGYDLVDMIGNVWEWTSSLYVAHGATAACCVGDDLPDTETRRVLKGGSHLCAPEYCLRYRPAARSPQSDDTSTTHIGFRCVYAIS
jgi:formylglycine-generating enzyme required for sulfatase activity